MVDNCTAVQRWFQECLAAHLCNLERKRERWIWIENNNLNASPCCKWGLALRPVSENVEDCHSLLAGCVFDSEEHHGNLTESFSSLKDKSPHPWNLASPDAALIIQHVLLQPLTFKPRDSRNASGGPALLSSGRWTSSGLAEALSKKGSYLQGLIDCSSSVPWQQLCFMLLGVCLTNSYQILGKVWFFSIILLSFRFWNRNAHVLVFPSECYIDSPFFFQKEFWGRGDLRTLTEFHFSVPFFYPHLQIRTVVANAEVFSRLKTILKEVGGGENSVPPNSVKPHLMTVNHEYHSNQWSVSPEECTVHCEVHCQ